MTPRLPTFLVIGAMKAGTTSLHAYLRSHPAVYLPERKELDYFVEAFNWRRGQAWYEAQFAAAGAAVAVGEASPSYTMHPALPGVPQRIAATVPDVRLVYSVRHPLDRMRSNYLHAVATGAERRPADRALSDDRRYLDCSRYAYQIERYLDHVDRSQLLVVVAEDLRHRRTETLNRILTFLEVPPTAPAAGLDEEHHRSATTRVRRPLARALEQHAAVRAVSGRVPQRLQRGYARLATHPLDPAVATLSPDVEAQLVDAVRDDVTRLRAYLPPDFDGWHLG